MSRDPAKGRRRATLHHDPQYYRIRNHLVDFLVARSKEPSHGRVPAQPLEVSPGLDSEPETRDPRDPHEPRPEAPKAPVEPTPSRSTA